MTKKKPEKVCIYKFQFHVVQRSLQNKINILERQSCFFWVTPHAFLFFPTDDKSKNKSGKQNYQVKVILLYKRKYADINQLYTYLYI